MGWITIDIGVPEQIRCIGDGLKVVGLSRAREVCLYGNLWWIYHGEIQYDNTVTLVDISCVEYKYSILVVG